MADKIATREAYGKALAEFGAKYDIIVLDADLSKSTKTEIFKKQFPERFINCGIAEGNMISVAAGIASCGKTVFASTFAMFAAGRAFEQIRNSVAYSNLNVKIGATHGGITVGEDGATHQCNEDLGIMRTIPNMVVLNPADAVEARLAVKEAILHNGPVFMRFGRLATPVIFDDSYNFEIGKGNKLTDGKDVTIVSCGIMTEQALIACESLKNEGINATVVNMCSIKPIDKDILIAAAKNTGCIVTAEEHNIIGGLGSAVCEALAESYPVPVLRVGIEDKFGKSGKVVPLMEYYGITAANIVEKAKAAIALKKK